MPVPIFEDYKKEILKHYVRVKNDPNHQLNRFLNKLTPGKIKSASRIVFEIENNTQDTHTLSSFFKVPKDKDFLKLLDTVDADKLIPVRQFLNQKTKEPREEVVEYAAWLLDFKPRPYSEFRRNDDIDLPKKGLAKLKITEEKPKGTKENTRRPPLDTIKITISIFFTIVVITYLGYNWQKKECMTWSEDHYEKVECNTKEISISYNQDWVDNFIKAKNDTIEDFFKEGGKPLYWYYKENNEIELFTLSGKHPENGKELKPITERIIRTYIHKE
ncbi:hypothetical protein [uncultured Aquimarina sp.]|uniref:hypothetical protein n=1 Tax=uncultured Aquimarina sp. TaxID=575652 RepID=UPI002611041F|nr:hypothetical protein [uncultured Aquimarina sp.]